IWARWSRSECATTAPASRPRSGPAVSAVLHDQADRRRDGSRALDQLGHRHATARGLDYRRQPWGRVHRMHNPPAAQQSGRGEERMRVSILVVDDETMWPSRPVSAFAAKHATAPGDGVW